MIDFMLQTTDQRICYTTKKTIKMSVMQYKVPVNCQKYGCTRNSHQDYGQFQLKSDTSRKVVSHGMFLGGKHQSSEILLDY